LSIGILCAFENKKILRKSYQFLLINYNFLAGSAAIFYDFRIKIALNEKLKYGSRNHLAFNKVKKGEGV